MYNLYPSTDIAPTIPTPINATPQLFSRAANPTVSVGFDVAKLLQDRPHLQVKYPLIKPGARRFLVG